MSSLMHRTACLLRLLAGVPLMALVGGAFVAPVLAAAEPPASQAPASPGELPPALDDAATEHHEHMQMSAALGVYPMAREASGTAWQPDSSVHEGLHFTRGEWTLMSHALLNGVYDS